MEIKSKEKAERNVNQSVEKIWVFSRAARKNNCINLQKKDKKKREKLKKEAERVRRIPDSGRK